jgi:hypothetical protein
MCQLVDASCRTGIVVLVSHSGEFFFVVGPNVVICVHVHPISAALVLLGVKRDNLARHALPMTWN